MEHRSHHHINPCIDNFFDHDSKKKLYLDGSIHFVDKHGKSITK